MLSFILFTRTQFIVPVTSHVIPEIILIPLTKTQFILQVTLYVISEITRYARNHTAQAHEDLSIHTVHKITYLTFYKYNHLLTALYQWSYV